MLEYSQLVLLLARKHAGLGWVAYDHQFRQQAAAGSTAPWSELNLSLMVATVFAAGGETPTRACSLCFAADHPARECALASLEVNRTPPKPPVANRTAARPKPYRAREEVCRRFNRAACSSPSCKFEHICSACQQPGHGSHECRKGSGKGATQDPPCSHHDPTSSDGGSVNPGPALCGSTPYAAACLYMYTHVTLDCAVVHCVDLWLSWGG